MGTARGLNTVRAINSRNIAQLKVFSRPLNAHQIPLSIHTHPNKLFAAASAMAPSIISYPADESKMRVQRIVKPLVTSPEFHPFPLGDCDVDAIVGALIVHLSDFECPHENWSHIE
jgi:hypothetical protein